MCRPVGAGSVRVAPVVPGSLLAARAGHAKACCGVAMQQDMSVRASAMSCAHSTGAFRAIAAMLLMAPPPAVRDHAGRPAPGRQRRIEAQGGFVAAQVAGAVVRGCRS